MDQPNPFIKLHGSDGLMVDLSTQHLYNEPTLDIAIVETSNIRLCQS